MGDDIKILLKELEDYFKEQKAILDKIAGVEDSIENSTARHERRYYERELLALYDDLYGLDKDMNDFYYSL